VKPPRHTTSAASEQAAGDDAVEVAYEVEIRPPIRKRLAQTLIALLAVVALGALAVATVMYDESQRATGAVTSAQVALSTTEARAAALEEQVQSLTSTLQAPGRVVTPAGGISISATQNLPPLPSEDPSLARSRTLAYRALTQLAVDPELGILIALEANRAARTPEAEDALRRALRASHISLRLRVPGADVRTAEFSPAGNFIVTTDSTGAARIWDAYTGQRYASWQGPGQAQVLSAQFSPDGRSVLTQLTDQTAVLWDAMTGSVVKVYPGFGVELTLARFSSSGDRLLAGGADGNVYMWHTRGGSDPLTLRSALGRITAVEWSPDDGRVLATGTAGVAVWDARTGEQLFTTSHATANQPAYGASLHAHFSPDGSQVAVAASGYVRLLDARTGQLIQTLNGALPGSSSDAEYSPNRADHLLFANGILWDAWSGQALGYYDMMWGYEEALFSPNGSYLVTYDAPSRLSVWDVGPRLTTRPDRLVASLQLKGYFIGARFSSLGQLAVVDTSGTASVWAIPAGDSLPNDYEGLLALARTSVTRPLTCQERHDFLDETAACPTLTPVEGLLTTQDGQTFVYRLLIPREWNLRYLVRNEGNTAYFYYDNSPRSMLFSITAYWAGQWQTEQHKPGLGARLFSQDGVVFAYNVALSNPYTDKQAEEFQRMAGQVQDVVRSLEVALWR
jgi:WD40 repeat protein